MKICDFTQPELNVFREQCNFTEEELEFFEYRARDKSLICIAHMMNISESKANVLSKKIKRKILKVI